MEDRNSCTECPYERNLSTANHKRQPLKDPARSYITQTRRPNQSISGRFAGLRLVDVDVSRPETAARTSHGMAGSLSKHRGPWHSRRQSPTAGCRLHIFCLFHDIRFQLFSGGPPTADVTRAHHGVLTRQNSNQIEVFTSDGSINRMHAQGLFSRKLYPEVIYKVTARVRMHHALFER